MKRFFATTTLCVFSLSIYGIAFAHGGEHRTLFGTITAVNDTRMTVSTSEQKSEVIELSPSTIYVIVDGGDARWSDLHAGTRVVVKLNAAGLVADEVRYASAQEKAVSEEHEHGEGHEHHHGDGTHE